ncbi:hypothetical protein PENANT_c027G04335 [Penicillium antarcticum]|uniref:PH domain-containing protein n=1 Tax=Penicillium antarcticum TaxID=416450 RepID=A0A1V6PXN2_9EURO|nr:uncharacterized protein N7508_003335 [Penicillium antarcticum]KAJ5312505.1 hypothetical protein N7508_003335 [Penicillium antarcticum]OQD81487.1 hypothetical protein PENANT_c027G04335 [Penicillium antarcticum]
MNTALTRPSVSEGRTPIIKVPDPRPSSHLLAGPRASRGNLDPFSPVNENGSFEFDRVVKTGRVQRRVKHKHVFRASWKPAYLVLRPNLLSVYKDEETTRLRVSIPLSEVTAVTPVKSARSTRKHVFGVFTPATNYRFEAPTQRDSEDWIQRIRAETPGNEDEQAFLALTNRRAPPVIQKQLVDETTDQSDFDLAGRASSPEPRHTRSTRSHAPNLPYIQDYSGNEGNEASFSEFSDGSPPTRNSHLRSMPSIHSLSLSAPEDKLAPLPRDASKPSDLGILRDPERVACQGYLQGLRIQGTVRQWKRLWVVLRPKSLAFYKDDAEYSALKIIPMAQVFDAAEVNPLSRSKTFCMQIIAEEKTYRLCAPDEESLARWLGSLKSILAARRKLDPALGSSV